MSGSRFGFQDVKLCGSQSGLHMEFFLDHHNEISFTDEADQCLKLRTSDHSFCSF